MNTKQKVEQKPNIIVDKTFNFSKEIIKTTITLKNDKLYELASQLFRSGTSIGANVKKLRQHNQKKISLPSLVFQQKKPERQGIG